MGLVICVRGSAALLRSREQISKSTLQLCLLFCHHESCSQKGKVEAVHCAGIVRFLQGGYCNTYILYNVQD